MVIEVEPIRLSFWMETLPPPLMRRAGLPTRLSPERESDLVALAKVMEPGVRTCETTMDSATALSSKMTLSPETKPMGFPSWSTKLAVLLKSQTLLDAEPRQ